MEIASWKIHGTSLLHCTLFGTYPTRAWGTFPKTETRMKEETKMFATAAAVLLALASMPAFAASGRVASSKAGVQHYCLNTSSGGSSCGYISLEQCQETMRGRNGWCTEQVDFAAWAAAHGGWYNNGGSEGSYASYPRGRMSPAEADMEKLHKDDMPSKGVGAE
jgi:Protein of unknown function (DUF3551)